LDVVRFDRLIILKDLSYNEKKARVSHGIVDREFVYQGRKHEPE
jgi:hypothetical protein